MLSEKEKEEFSKTVKSFMLIKFSYDRDFDDRMVRDQRKVLLDQGKKGLQYSYDSEGYDGLLFSIEVLSADIVDYIFWMIDCNDINDLDNRTNEDHALRLRFEWIV